MAQIDVQEQQQGSGWSFSVTVSEGGSATRHKVTLAKGDYDRLSGGKTPSDLVRKSFEFLLARESKESILSSFDLTLIGSYFPEYEEKIRG